ncbi:hypothetical protein [Larkinella sp.]|uniref:hypothetical protein n=1 Tax=Larkinella sp. TaxID=2034517 RepID=UPI003BACA902
MGHWQLIPATVHELGLTTRFGRDDVQKSTDAACRYLRYRHDSGRWSRLPATWESEMC